MSQAVESRVWLAFFERSALRNLDLSGADAHVLTDAERQRITASIQVFQLGESSEGRSLIAMAAGFAAVAADPAYLATMKLLVREENRHSGYLRTFMQEHGIARRQRTWSDGCFRVVRKLAGLELSLRVLVSAELLAIVYYRSLGVATGSCKLAGICARMLEEEEQHIRFQLASIGRLNARKPRWLQAVSDAAHAGMYAAATLTVWTGHTAVLRAQHAGWRAFFGAAWAVFAAATTAQRRGDGRLPAATAMPETSRRPLCRCARATPVWRPSWSCARITGD